MLVNGKASPSLHVEQAVTDRYSAASQVAEASLCCPVEYDTQYLQILPEEILERDYGCGDPSKYVLPGDTVLDLGSGGGKICYIASQVVGAEGRVIGVDMNDDMLDLARKYRDEMGQRIGWNNVEFHKGRIQDLGLDLELLEKQLADSPVRTANDWLDAQRFADELRRERPMIPDHSVDIVVSNCVLNLVSPADRTSLFSEIARVLKRGGRAVISDIVSDEFVPESMKNDPELWSGCISGAFVEDEFLRAFEQVGLYGVEILNRQEEPWAVIEGIEFRSMTVRAFKGKDGPCDDFNQAVIYQGPWKSVSDDDGHLLKRGVRTAVCKKTFEIYSKQPYLDSIIPVPSSIPVSATEAKPFDCHGNKIRAASESKRGLSQETNLPGGDECGSNNCC